MITVCSCEVDVLIAIVITFSVISYNHLSWAKWTPIVFIDKYHFLQDNYKIIKLLTMGICSGISTEWAWWCL